MEGLADRPFRRALASVGGFDEACTEFIRIPGCMPETHAQLLKAAAKLTSNAYDARELGDTPLAAQLMGSIPAFLGEAARHLAGTLGAHRVDLNCGCPANTVTGRGAGSSLLREPSHLGDCVAAMTAAVAGSGAVVTVKLRAGFDDASLFDSNLEAALQAGAAFVTLHPRTRAQGYSGAADWNLIRRAKQRAGAPVVGNGDVTSVARALALLKHAGCDAVMIGRGAATDPLIFRRIRAAFGAEEPIPLSEEPVLIESFLRRYYAELADTPPPKSCHGERSPGEDARFRIGKLKQLANYLLRGHGSMAAPLAELLRRGGYAHASETPKTLAVSDEMLEDIVHCVRLHWAGAPRDVLIDNFSSRSGYAGVTQRVMPLDSELLSVPNEPSLAEEPPLTTKNDSELMARALAQRRRKQDDRAAWLQRKARAAERRSSGTPTAL